MAAKWSKLSQNGTAPGARSSHAVAVVGTKAYVFGGEFTPRVPVDNNVHVFDLVQHTWSVLPATGDIPPPRVGVTMAAVGPNIYVFGGRDKEHKELNELYSFDTVTHKWALLSSGTEGPPHRSYHSMTADDQRVYVFGGCGNSGRLNDLWAFDTETNNWAQLPSPGDNCRGRGGPGFVVAKGKVWVIYGFGGEELNDVHCFDPVTNTWTEVDTTGHKPSARSVFSSVSVGKDVVIYGGEIDPSDLGHMGAGMFSGEVFVLDTESCNWSKMEAFEGNELPGPRGWCAFARANVDGDEGLLVYGGNSPSNDRLDDIFFLAPGL